MKKSWWAHPMYEDLEKGNKPYGHTAYTRRTKSGKLSQIGARGTKNPQLQSEISEDRALIQRVQQRYAEPVGATSSHQQPKKPISGHFVLGIDGTTRKIGASGSGHVYVDDGPSSRTPVAVGNLEYQGVSNGKHVWKEVWKSLNAADAAHKGESNMSKGFACPHCGEAVSKAYAIKSLVVLAKSEGQDLSAELDELANDDLEKGSKSTIKNPGSRGGKFWMDEKGITRYGQRPTSKMDSFERRHSKLNDNVDNARTLAGYLFKPLAKLAITANKDELVEAWGEASKRAAKDPHFANLGSLAHAYLRQHAEGKVFRRLRDAWVAHTRGHGTGQEIQRENSPANKIAQGGGMKKSLFPVHLGQPRLVDYMVNGDESIAKGIQDGTHHVPPARNLQKEQEEAVGE